MPLSTPHQQHIKKMDGVPNVLHGKEGMAAAVIGFSDPISLSKRNERKAFSWRLRGRDGMNKDADRFADRVFSIPFLL